MALTAAKKENVATAAQRAHGARRRTNSPSVIVQAAPGRARMSHAGRARAVEAKMVAAAAVVVGARWDVTSTRRHEITLDCKGQM